MPEWDRHHRRCRSRGGNNKPENISLVRRGLHVAYHKLFSNRNVFELAALLNEVWIDPNYELIVVERTPKCGSGS